LRRFSQAWSHRYLNDVSGGVVSHVGHRAEFWMIVLAMIYALGEVSAHISIRRYDRFFAAQRFPMRLVPASF